MKEMNLDYSEHPYAYFLSFVLYICNLSVSTFLVKVDIGHITQVAELVKVIVGIICPIIGTIFMYVIHRKTIRDFVRGAFKRR